MGYRTYYDLLQTQPELEVTEIPGLQKAVEQLGGGEIFEYDGSSGESCTWYEHEEDMEALSEQFPDVTFVLHGEGENQGDVWDKYFKYGKLQATARPEVVWPEVDTGKFKP